MIKAKDIHPLSQINCVTFPLIIKKIEEEKDFEVDFTDVKYVDSHEEIAKAIIEKKLKIFNVPELNDRNRIDYYQVIIKQKKLHKNGEIKISELKEKFKPGSTAILYTASKTGNNNNYNKIEKDIIVIENYGDSSVSVRKYKYSCNQPILFKVLGFDNIEMYEIKKISYYELDNKSFLIAKPIYDYEKGLLKLLFNEKNRNADIDAYKYNSTYKFNFAEYAELSTSKNKIDFVQGNPFFEYFENTILLEWLMDEKNKNTIKNSIYNVFSKLGGNYYNQSVKECYDDIIFKVIERKERFNPKYFGNDTYKIETGALSLVKRYSHGYWKDVINKENKTKTTLNENKYDEYNICEEDDDECYVYENYEDEGEDEIKLPNFVNNKIKSRNDYVVNKELNIRLNKIFNSLSKYDKNFNKRDKFKDFDTRKYVLHKYLEKHNSDEEKAKGMGVDIAVFTRYEASFKTIIKYRTNEKKVDFKEMLINHGYITKTDIPKILENYEKWKKEIDEHNKIIEEDFKNKRKHLRENYTKQSKKHIKKNNADELINKEKEKFDKRILKLNNEKRKLIKSATFEEYLIENKTIKEKKLKEIVVDWENQLEFKGLDEYLNILKEGRRIGWKPKFK